MTNIDLKKIITIHMYISYLLERLANQSNSDNSLLNKKWILLLDKGRYYKITDLLEIFIYEVVHHYEFYKKSKNNELLYDLYSYLYNIFLYMHFNLLDKSFLLMDITNLPDRDIFNKIEFFKYYDDCVNYYNMKND